MQVPAGKPLAGMAHHKIHDERVDRPAAAAAPGPAAARAAPAVDRGDAEPGRRRGPGGPPVRARTTRRSRHGTWPPPRPRGPRPRPTRRSTPPADGVGGGPYDDDDVTDEFYWAAAELYITTGAKAYRDAVARLAARTPPTSCATDGFDWGTPPQLGRLDLATVPNALPGRAPRCGPRWSTAPTATCATAAHPRLRPAVRARRRTRTTGARTAWSLNNLVVLATAYDLTGEAQVPRRRAARAWTTSSAATRSTSPTSPATARSASHNQHSRWYAHQLNPDLPNPPAGHAGRRPELVHPGPGGASRSCQGCAAAVLLHRRHRVVVDQRDDHQLERAAGLGRRLRRRPGQR